MSEDDYWKLKTVVNDYFIVWNILHLVLRSLPRTYSESPPSSTQICVIRRL